MEDKKPKRNFIPIIILLIIIGVGAAVLAKPSVGNINTDSTKSYTTICHTPWISSDNSTTGYKLNIPGMSEGEHVCGNPNAPVVIVQYTDFECPFCKQFHPTLQRIVAESDGKVAWVLRHYPIDELHDRARNEALASECAYELGGDIAFWKYTDKIFEVTSSNDSLSPALLPVIASDIGLDKAAFSACLESGRHLAKISAQEKLAEDKGPIGTPNSRIIIDGKEVEEVKGAVDYNTLKAKVDLWVKATN